MTYLAQFGLVCEERSQYVTLSGLEPVAICCVSLPSPRVMGDCDQHWLLLLNLA